MPHIYGSIHTTFIINDHYTLYPPGKTYELLGTHNVNITTKFKHKEDVCEGSGRDVVHQLTFLQAGIHRVAITNIHTNRTIFIAFDIENHGLSRPMEKNNSCWKNHGIDVVLLWMVATMLDTAIRLMKWKWWKNEKVWMDINKYLA